MSKYSPMDVARFWSKADVGAPASCWLWRGAMGKSYGNFFHNGAHVNAHRVSFEIFNGVDLGEAWGCHHCDNKRCVNPLHIYPGSLETNTADAKERDSFIVATRDHHGERNPNNKLRVDQVAKIKRLILDGGSNVAIGKQFGVSDGMISHIRRGKSWAHIPAVGEPAANEG